MDYVRGVTGRLNAIDQVVTSLVPSLSRSLAEQFNVLRVMHHGTHEKQLSNVFAWLLQPDGTHELGDAFQRIFVDRLNRDRPADDQLPTTGYRVIQEVNTTGPAEAGRDIADIVLVGERASIVVENYGSSDGHGHDYGRHLAHGAVGEKKSVVVLLCVRRESHRQTSGWEHAAVVTYAEFLVDIKQHLDRATAWRRAHPRQDIFINELVEHFVGGPAAVNTEDRIGFIKAMCDSGESARYGHRPQETAAQEFANLVGQHAKQQFEDGRRTLAKAKKSLKRYAEHTLIGQVNGALEDGEVTSIQAPFVGQREWCVALRRSSEPDIFLEFGPTAVVENGRVAEPVDSPDFTKVFVTRQSSDDDGIDVIRQTGVSLDEVLEGLPGDDLRLRDAVLATVRAI